MRWPWQRPHERDLFRIGDIPLSTTDAAVAVNPATAMQHSAVWACGNLIAGSNLPDFLYAVLQSLLVRGTAYGLIVDRAGAGLLPAQVELLAPERVGVAVDGTVEYRVDGQLVDPASVWHVKAFTTAGAVVGLAHRLREAGRGAGHRGREVRGQVLR